MKTKHKQDKRTNQNKTSNTDKENRVVITRVGERDERGGKQVKWVK